MSAPDIPFGLLMVNLERELRDLVLRCRMLQSAAAGDDGRPPLPGMMIALQDLDPLTQILDDLAGLAAGAAQSPLARIRIDPAILGAPLRLESLRQRLLASASPGPTAEPEGFLL
ncbi:hypothetical protein GI374_09615 [Paracoccus sp. S-4012]|uniref:hypothetical protein n=1 Tax=Paracoccus sp. S-4012 TaxID=2665648 RepID=UPI0012AFC54B|nr:hypothetical protein [Paracoccus sp. S-4012]MRX50696.1 hypothetical protein [Paracoccus sp. S-4012]